MEHSPKHKLTMKTAEEIARLLAAESEVETRIAKSKAREWIQTTLEERIDDDLAKWGDANPDSLIEDVATYLDEEITAAFDDPELGLNKSPEDVTRLVRELIDAVMSESEIIVADAQDAISDGQAYRRSPNAYYGVSDKDFF